MTLKFASHQFAKKCSECGRERKGCERPLANQSGGWKEETRHVVKFSDSKANYKKGLWEPPGQRRQRVIGTEEHNRQRVKTDRLGYP